jgi:hypothetical protein
MEGTTSGARYLGTVARRAGGAASDMGGREAREELGAAQGIWVWRRFVRTVA